MIDMGVRQEDCVDLSRRERQGAVVQRAHRLRALEEPAVDEHAAARMVEPERCPGDRADGAVKGERDRHAAASSIV
jgi:hypothetical protein